MRRLFLVLALLALAAPAFAAEPHPFTVHDLLAMERISDPEPSPQGDKVAFELRTTDLEALREQAVRNTSALAHAVEERAAAIYTALVAHGETMTFAELQDRSRAVAGVLAQRGIGPERTVGLAIPRSLDSIVALFAVLRVGAAYVPLELDHPDERIAAIIDDARPDVILTVTAVSPRLTGDLIELDRPLSVNGTFTDSGSLKVPFTDFGPDRLRHPAYTIYTSGSTGKPKGVVTEYAGLTNMLINHQRRIFGPVLAEHGDRVFRIAHTVSFAFDMSFYGLSLFAVFYGLDWIATVPPTVRLAARIFGAERGPIMFGWIAAAHQLGAALAAFTAGVLRVTLGTYLEAFMLSGLLCLIASLMVLFIGRQGAAAPVPVPAE